MELGATQWTRENVLYGTIPDIISEEPNKGNNCVMYVVLLTVETSLISVGPLKYSLVSRIVPSACSLEPLRKIINIGYRHENQTLWRKFPLSSCSQKYVSFMFYRLR